MRELGVWLESGINDASAFLYVASKHTSFSDWATYEVTKSVSLKDKPIISIVLDDVGKKTLPKTLAQFQWSDFTSEERYEDSLNNLIDALLDYIRIHSLYSQN